MEESSEQVRNRHNVGLWRKEQFEREREKEREGARSQLAKYEPPEYEPVTLAELRIDERYQRARSEAKVHTLRAMFNPRACQPLAVSKRGDGSLYLVDGQHRMAALQDIGINTWPACVHANLTRRDEAAMWEELNTRQTKPPPPARFKARLERREPEAMAIHGVVLGSGLRLNFKRGRSKTSGVEIDAVDAIERIYRRGNERALGDVLKLLQKAWPDPDESQRTARVILLGLAEFLASDWAAEIKLGRAAERIAQFTPSTWISKTRGATSGESPAVMLCEKFRAVYNKGAKKNEKL
jgi:ParB-like nuclease domain